MRYADDFLLLTQRKQDAERLLTELATRFAQFGLSLHEEKTRLLAFGRYAASSPAGGTVRPRCPTFSFLGFTFYMGKSLAGHLVAKLKTQRERMISKLKVLRREMKARRHWSVAEQQHWLAAVLRGYYAYYGITGNARDRPLLPANRQVVALGAPSARAATQAPLGAVQGHPVPPSAPGPADCARLAQNSCRLSRVTRRRSRMRESRTSGSV